MTTQAKSTGLVRTYTLIPIAFKEKGYCGTCEGYETIVGQMADDGGDEWEVCEDCVKQFREQAAKFPLKNFEATPKQEALIAEVEAAKKRIEGEIFDCQQLEKDYSNRSKKELDDEWITADEIQHRIGGLKFALVLLERLRDKPSRSEATTEKEICSECKELIADNDHSPDPETCGSCYMEGRGGLEG